MTTEATSYPVQEVGPSAVARHGREGHGNNVSHVPTALKAPNVTAVPQRSPFRYPGGKTWLVPFIRQWLDVHGGEDVELIEPFAGGGIVTLTSVMEGLVGSATMTERDENVAAVWRAILGRSGRRLAEDIRTFEFTEQTVNESLQNEPRNLRQHAFQTILRNRVNRNGILAPRAGRLRGGESGRGLGSRWYAETLAKRILDIVEVRDKITFKTIDGLRYMGRRIKQSKLVYFIDPPYCDVGKRLYAFGEVNHQRLFGRTAQLEGDFLMTYSNTEEIRTLANKYGFHTRLIQMNGGSNKVKTELLIGRNLGWLTLRSSKLAAEPQATISIETPAASKGLKS